jgi:hypothetical protein
LDKQWDDEAELTIFKLSNFTNALKYTEQRPFTCWSSSGKEDTQNVTCQGVDYSGVFYPTASSDSFEFLQFKDNNEYTYDIKEGHAGFWCVSADYNPFQKVSNLIEFSEDGSNGKSTVSNYLIFWMLVSLIPTLIIWLISGLYLKLVYSLLLIMTSVIAASAFEILELSLNHFNYSQWNGLYRSVVGVLRVVSECYAFIVVIDKVFNKVEGCNGYTQLAVFLNASLTVQKSCERAGQNPIYTLLPTSSLVFNLANIVLVSLIYLAYVFGLIFCGWVLACKVYRTHTDDKLVMVFSSSMLIFFCGDILLKLFLIAIVDVRFIESFRASVIFWISIIWRPLVTLGCFVAVVVYSRLSNELQVEYSLPSLPNK